MVFKLTIYDWRLNLYDFKVRERHMTLLPVNGLSAKYKAFEGLAAQL